MRAMIITDERKKIYLTLPRYRFNFKIYHRFL